MKNLFGEWVPEPDEMIRGARTKRKPTKPNGYVWHPGTGPAGETCKTCAHIARIETRAGNVYRKCGLNRLNWTGGPGSDILAKTPACLKWEKPQAVPSAKVER